MALPIEPFTLESHICAEDAKGAAQSTVVKVIKAGIPAIFLNWFFILSSPWQRREYYNASPISSPPWESNAD
jgi:hypothetical protein